MPGTFTSCATTPRIPTSCTTRACPAESRKRHPGPDEHRCPRCSGPMACAGHDFAPPRRRDTKAWTVVAAVLNAGLRYEGRELCGCGKEPKFRPRTGSAPARAPGGLRPEVLGAATLSRPLIADRRDSLVKKAQWIGRWSSTTRGAGAMRAGRRLYTRTGRHRRDPILVFILFPHVILPCVAP